MPPWSPVIRTSDLPGPAVKVNSSPLFRLLVLAAVLSLPWATFAQGDPTMVVTIKPGAVDEEIGKGHLDITMVLPGVSADRDVPLFSMPIVVANTESVARTITVVDASDDAGPLPVYTRDDLDGPLPIRHWQAPRPVAGTLSISYRAEFDNTPPARGAGPPIMPRIDGRGVSGAGSMFLLDPATTDAYRIAVRWDLSAMSPRATATSSFGDGDFELPAGPANRLGGAVFMAGELQRYPGRPGAGFSASWSGKPPFDPAPLMTWARDLHEWMSGFFGVDQEAPYRLFLRFNPINAGGGTALTNSFLLTYNDRTRPDIALKSVLSHEMVHTWTRGGPGQWYGEGIAVYYQALLPWRAGLITAAEYLQDINQTASRYYSNALRYMSNEEAAPRFWEDTRIRTLPYDRGAMYFVMLNAWIRKASGGERSLDDLVMEVNRRVGAGGEVDEDAWVDLITAELGDEARLLHQAMVAGGLMLPADGDFGPCFTRVSTRIRAFDLGFDPASLVGDRKVIRGLVPGSEADKAGLRNGDVVTYRQALDSVQADPQALLRLYVERDGESLEIEYLPRGRPVEIFQWKEKADTAEADCAW